MLPRNQTGLSFLKFFSAIALVLTVFVPPPSVANDSVITVRGIARIEYAPIKDNHGLYRKLVHEAKKGAIKNYMATMPQSKLKLMDRYFDDITSYENIDKFVLGFSPIGAPCNTGVSKNGKPNCGQIKDKTLNLAINAQISTTAIDNYLQSQSVAASSAAGESSEFAVLFIARTTTGKKIFQDKISNVRQEKSADNTSITNASDGTSNVAGVAQESLAVTTTGGSIEKKADELTYEVDSSLSKDLGSAIKDYLVQAGFETIDSDDIVEENEDKGVYYIDEMIKQGMFGDDGSMPRRTLNAFKKVAIAEGMKFFGVGRVDLGLPAKNPVTGFVEVPAKVTFEVFMDSKGRSRSVAVVRPQVVYGEDPRGNAEVAQQNAQRGAVKLAMDSIIAQLQAKNLY